MLCKTCNEREAYPRQPLCRECSNIAARSRRARLNARSMDEQVTRTLRNHVNRRVREGTLKKERCTTCNRISGLIVTFPDLQNPENFEWICKWCRAEAKALLDIDG